jgi:hypothetical protein
VCYHRDDFGPTRLQRPNFVRTEVAAIRDACDRRGIRVFLIRRCSSLRSVGSGL